MDCSDRTKHLQGINSNSRNCDVFFYFWDISLTKIVQKHTRGEKPGTPDSFSESERLSRTKASPFLPPLFSSPSSTMTGRWISGGFGFGRRGLRERGVGECEETPPHHSPASTWG